MELLAYRNYNELHYDINFWRTKTRLEVDFILAKGEIAIEVKGKEYIDNKDVKPLKAFIDEYKPKKSFLICNEKRKRVYNNITIIPCREFLQDLWDNTIIT